MAKQVYKPYLFVTGFSAEDLELVKNNTSAWERRLVLIQKAKENFDAKNKPLAVHVTLPPKPKEIKPKPPKLPPPIPTLEDGEDFGLDFEPTNYGQSDNNDN